MDFEGCESWHNSLAKRQTTPSWHTHHFYPSHCSSLIQLWHLVLLIINSVGIQSLPGASSCQLYSTHRILLLSWLKYLFLLSATQGFVLTFTQHGHSIVWKITCLFLPWRKSVIIPPDVLNICLIKASLNGFVRLHLIHVHSLLSVLCVNLYVNLLAIDIK